MRGIDDDGVDIQQFEQAIQRLPVYACAFYCHHFAAGFMKPTRQFLDFAGYCAKLSQFTSAAFSQASQDELFAHVDSTTTPIDNIPGEASLFRYRGALSYAFTLLCVLALIERQVQSVVQRESRD